MGKLTLTDEQRQARRDNLAKLRAEGKVGPEFGKLGGRPRKKRASEIAAEKASENGEKIWGRLNDLLDSENEKVVLDTIKHIHTIEEQERKIQVETEVRYDQLRREELLAIVFGNLEELVAEGKIDLGSFAGDIVDAEFREVDGTGEEDERPQIESGHERTSDS